MTHNQKSRNFCETLYRQRVGCQTLNYVALCSDVYQALLKQRGQKCASKAYLIKVHLQATVKLQRLDQ